MRLIKYLLLFLLLLPFGHAGPAQEFTEPTTFTLRLADPFALLFAYHRLDLSGNVSRIQVDLDGDGELDWLITADGIWRDRQGSLWSVFLRDGDEFITPISSLGRGALTFHERSFFVGDWDGNGRIELVARYHVSGAISHLAAYRITPRGIEERTIDPKWYREDHPEWDEKFKNFKDQLTVESIPIGTLLDKYPAHGYLDKQAFDDGKAHSRIETTPTDDGYTSTTSPQSDFVRQTPPPRRTIQDPLAHGLRSHALNERSTIVEWDSDWNGDGLLDRLIGDLQPTSPTQTRCDANLYLRRPDGNFDDVLPTRTDQALSVSFNADYFSFGVPARETVAMLISARPAKQGQWQFDRFQLGPDELSRLPQTEETKLDPDAQPHQAALLAALQTSATLIRNSPAWREHSLAELAPKYRFNTYSDYNAHITAGMEDPAALAYRPDGKGGYTTQSLSSLRRDPRDFDKFLSRQVQDPLSDFIAVHDLPSSGSLLRLIVDFNNDDAPDQFISYADPHPGPAGQTWNLYIKLSGAPGYLTEQHETDPRVSIQFPPDAFYLGEFNGLGAGTHLLVDQRQTPDIATWIDYRLFGQKLSRSPMGAEDALPNESDLQALIHSFPQSAPIETIPLVGVQ